MPEGQDGIQRDLDKPEKLACVNLMRFNKTKCKVLHMDQGSPLYQYIINHKSWKYLRGNLQYLLKFYIA